MRRKVKKFIFLYCNFGLLYTFAVALLVADSLEQPSLAKIAYFATCVGALLLVLVNVARPIFLEPVFPNLVLRPRYALLTLLAVLVSFSAMVGYLLQGRPDAMAFYKKYYLIMQVVNATYAWAILCALAGQKNFHPFFVDIVRRPPFAIGYWAARLVDVKSRRP